MIDNDLGGGHYLCLRFFKKVQSVTPSDRRSGFRSVSGIWPTCQCRCPPLPIIREYGGGGEKEALESNRFSASPSLIPQLRFIRVSELGLSVGFKQKNRLRIYCGNCFTKNYEKYKDFRKNIGENFAKIVKFIRQEREINLYFRKNCNRYVWTIFSKLLVKQQKFSEIEFHEISSKSIAVSFQP